MNSGHLGSSLDEPTHDSYQWRIFMEVMPLFMIRLALVSDQNNIK